MFGLLFRTFLENRVAMKKRSQIIAGTIITIVLVAITVIVILVSTTLSGKPQKTPTAEVSVVYPAPGTNLPQKGIVNQGAYPPPPTAGKVPTNTAPLINITASPVAGGELTLANVQRVTLEDAKTAFDGNKAIFLDVRSAGSYTSSHIPGAISIPEAQIMEHLSELDPEQWIITYCS
jgi:hypothetical protein